MKCVAIIPAKGTSRRVPGKNRKMFHSYPIISYSIRAAQDSGLFNRVVVSTDDDWIGRYSEGCGATWYTRARELTEENAGTQEVTVDVLRAYRAGDDPYDYACCIYPCAPMMTGQDLVRALDWLEFSKGKGYAHIPGWFYFAEAATFLNGVPVEESAPMMAPRDRYIDINTPEDWAKAEAMYAALHQGVA